MARNNHNTYKFISHFRSKWWFLVVKKIVYTVLYSCMGNERLEWKFLVFVSRNKREKWKLRKLIKTIGTKCTQYGTRWRLLLLHNRGVNTALPHLRARTVLNASYIFVNRRRVDGHAVNQIGPVYQGFESRSGNQIGFFFKTSTQPPISGAKAAGGSS